MPIITKSLQAVEDSKEATQSIGEGTEGSPPRQNDSANNSEGSQMELTAEKERPQSQVTFGSDLRGRMSQKVYYQLLETVQRRDFEKEALNKGKLTKPIKGIDLFHQKMVQSKNAFARRSYT